MNSQDIHLMWLIFRFEIKPLLNFLEMQILYYLFDFHVIFDSINYSNLKYLVVIAMWMPQRKSDELSKSVRNAWHQYDI